ncbi:MAG: hypothetical protein HY260_17780, partial [Chloroflexi bacterium]|nr:hypothetical protein [Chloroflexota bacterium]
MTTIFDKLFGRRKPDAPRPWDDTVPSQPAVQPPIPAATPPSQPTVVEYTFKEGAPGSPRLRVGHAQDVGKVRSHNEDVLLAITGSLEGLIATPAFGLFIIADGMGGHSLGERASAVASRTIAREIVARLYQPLLANPDALADADRPPLNEVMRAALEEANRA